MPAKSPAISKTLEKKLQELGQRLRDRRKQLGVSATVAAEAAEMSRITLNRIERGEASVSMGAYLSVVASLGLEVDLKDPRAKKLSASVTEKLPKKIKIASYGQLKKIAWQLKDTTELTAQEALDMYERNWRHIDLKKMDNKEKKLLELLLASFGRERLLV